MLPIIILYVVFAIVIILFALNLNNYIMYWGFGLTDNTLAVRTRNKAIIYGFLCIIFVLAIVLNRDEFISNNQFNNCPMDEQSNATTRVACPWTENEHGSTVARVNFTLLKHV